jgi:UDPglucose--hexose-1-phosphate uridylyltransferase
MSTLRQDPTTKEWVILAPRRATRPHTSPDLTRPVEPSFVPTCPFCPGNEHQTPPEAMRLEDEGGWRVRVVPNLYPALNGGGSTERGGEPMFREMPGVGYHEVIIESARHDARLDEAAPELVSELMWVWRERYRVLNAEPWARSVIVFKNFGPRAGTSLAHPHSQVVATPVLAPQSLMQFAVATRYYDDTGHSVYEHMIEAERRAAERIVGERGNFIAFNPFASRVPFETWIAPTYDQASFGRVDDYDLGEFGTLLQRTLQALRRAADDPDFNLVLASAHTEDENKPVFRWHMRILPRMATRAGFELGSGMDINTMAPEDSAVALREAIAALAHA